MESVSLNGINKATDSQLPSGPSLSSPAVAVVGGNNANVGVSIVGSEGGAIESCPPGFRSYMPAIVTRESSTREIHSVPRSPRGTYDTQAPRPLESDTVGTKPAEGPPLPPFTGYSKVDNTRIKWDRFSCLERNEEVEAYQIRTQRATVKQLVELGKAVADLQVMDGQMLFGDNYLIRMKPHQPSGTRGKSLSLKQGAVLAVYIFKGEATFQNPIGETTRPLAQGSLEKIEQNGNVCLLVKRAQIVSWIRASTSNKRHQDPDVSLLRHCDRRFVVLEGDCAGTFEKRKAVTREYHPLHENQKILYDYMRFKNLDVLSVRDDIDVTMPPDSDEDDSQSKLSIKGRMTDGSDPLAATRELVAIGTGCPEREGNSKRPYQADRIPALPETGTAGLEDALQRPPAVKADQDEESGMSDTGVPLTVLAQMGRAQSAPLNGTNGSAAAKTGKLKTKYTIPPELVKGLNSSQRQAIAFCLTNYPVSLLQGPPGTGKSTTVAALIHILVHWRKRVLVTAPSNYAVDNLMRMCALPNALRVGNPARVSADLRDKVYMPQTDEAKREGDCLKRMRQYRTFRPPGTHGMQELACQVERRLDLIWKECYKRPHFSYDGPYPVWMWNKACNKEYQLLMRRAGPRILQAQAVFATCVSANGDAILDSVGAQEGVFDYVIIDEAGQSAEVDAWMPARLGCQLILVGDPMQLPCCVKSNTAQIENLGQSILDTMLEEIDDRSKVLRVLEIQYRMNTVIMEWSSKLFYESKLRAHKSVRDWRLSPQTPEIAWVDTKGCGYAVHEDRAPGRKEWAQNFDASRSNRAEAELVARYLERCLLPILGPDDTIGVISPYNRQVRKLDQKVAERFPKEKRIEVATIDSFQGRECDCVVVSLVRSNPSRQVGFLEDERRLNVAMTRAKKHLCIVGDSLTVSSCPTLKNLVEYVERNGTYLDCLAFLQFHELDALANLSADEDGGEASVDDHVDNIWQQPVWQPPALGPAHDPYLSQLQAMRARVSADVAAVQHRSDVDSEINPSGDAGCSRVSKNCRRRDVSDLHHKGRSQRGHNFSEEDTRPIRRQRRRRRRWDDSSMTSSSSTVEVGDSSYESHERGRRDSSRFSADDRVSYSSSERQVHVATTRARQKPRRQDMHSAVGEESEDSSGDNPERGVARRRHHDIPDRARLEVTVARQHRRGNQDDRRDRHRTTNKRDQYRNTDHGKDGNDERRDSHRGSAEADAEKKHRRKAPVLRGDESNPSWSDVSEDRDGRPRAENNDTREQSREGTLTVVRRCSCSSRGECLFHIRDHRRDGVDDGFDCVGRPAARRDNDDYTANCYTIPPSRREDERAWDEEEAEEGSAVIGRSRSRSKPSGSVPQCWQLESEGYGNKNDWGRQPTSAAICPKVTRAEKAAIAAVGKSKANRYHGEGSQRQIETRADYYSYNDDTDYVHSRTGHQYVTCTGLSSDKTNIKLGRRRCDENKSGRAVDHPDSLRGRRGLEIVGREDDVIDPDEEAGFDGTGGSSAEESEWESRQCSHKNRKIAEKLVRRHHRHHCRHVDPDAQIIRAAATDSKSKRRQTTDFQAHVPPSTATKSSHHKKSLRRRREEADRGIRKPSEGVAATMTTSRMHPPRIVGLSDPNITTADLIQTKLRNRMKCDWAQPRVDHISMLRGDQDESSANESSEAVPRRRRNTRGEGGLRKMANPYEMDDDGYESLAADADDPLTVEIPLGPLPRNLSSRGMKAETQLVTQQESRTTTGIGRDLSARKLLESRRRLVAAAVLPSSRASKGLRDVREEDYNDSFDDGLDVYDAEAKYRATSYIDSDEEEFRTSNLAYELPEPRAVATEKARGEDKKKKLRKTVHAKEKTRQQMIKTTGENNRGTTAKDDDALLVGVSSDSSLWDLDGAEESCRERDGGGRKPAVASKTSAASSRIARCAIEQRNAVLKSKTEDLRRQLATHTNRQTKVNHQT